MWVNVREHGDNMKLILCILGALLMLVEVFKVIFFVVGCHKHNLVDLCASHKLLKESRWGHNYQYLPALAHLSQGPICMRGEGWT